MCFARTETDVVGAEFVGDADANKLLTREYRKGFEIPKFTIGESAHHEQAKK